MYPSNIKQNLGFTLLEAMITVAIIGILSSIASPSYQNFIKSHFPAKISSELFGDLRSLRQLAISQASNIVICASNDQSTCSANATNANNWSDGWIAFSDINQNNQRESDSEDILILKTGLSTGDVIYSGGAVLTFDYRGELSTSEQFSICTIDDDANLNRAIIMNKVGRALRAQPEQLDTVISCS